MRPFPTIVDVGGNFFQSESLLSEHQNHHSENYGRTFAEIWFCCITAMKLWFRHNLKVSLHRNFVLLC